MSSIGLLGQAFLKFFAPAQSHEAAGSPLGLSFGYAIIATLHFSIACSDTRNENDGAFTLSFNLL